MYLTPTYASLAALIYMVLSFRVIGLRRTFRVALGDDGRTQLRRAMRVHANFAEYAPFGFLLIFMVEALNGPAWAIHALAGLLLLGRGVHALGVSRESENLNWRTVGMVATFLAIIAAAIANLTLTLAGFIMG